MQGMRMVLGVVAIALLLVESGSIGKPARIAANVTPVSSTAKARVDFETQLEPIFKSKCMPCHFSGGKVYDRLPFDKPETNGGKVYDRLPFDKPETIRKL